MSSLNHCPSCNMELSRIMDVAEEGSITFCPRCQFPLMLVTHKYQLRQILRHGGCSIVYLAHHIHLDQDAERVIKVIRPEIFKIKGMERRFKREVQITSALSQRNEHIVRIYDDFGEIPNLGHFYVMEYLKGEPWSWLLEAHNELPSLPLCMHLFLQLCDTMQFAHERGIVHRDLKPDNLMLVQRKHDPYFLKILDFGIAKPFSNDELAVTKATQGSLGTPSYMSPEQCLNQDTDARTDIYSMGIILFELLSGRLPFLPPQGAHSNRTSFVSLIEAQIIKEPPSLRALQPERVPERLEQIVMKALEKKPENRFQAVDELRLALEEFISLLPAEVQDEIVNLSAKADDPLSRRVRLKSHSPERPQVEPENRTLFLGRDGQVAVEVLDADKESDTDSWHTYVDAGQPHDAMVTERPTPTSREQLHQTSNNLANVAGETPVMVLADASEAGTIEMSDGGTIELSGEDSVQEATGGTVELREEDLLPNSNRTALLGSGTDMILSDLLQKAQLDEIDEDRKTQIFPENASSVLTQTPEQTEDEGDLLVLSDQMKRKDEPLIVLESPRRDTLSDGDVESLTMQDPPSDDGHVDLDAAEFPLAAQTIKDAEPMAESVRLKGDGPKLTHNDLSVVPLTAGGEADVFYSVDIVDTSTKKRKQTPKQRRGPFGGIVDRIQGPRGGKVNLFLLQREEWSLKEPAKKALRQRINQVKNLMKSKPFLEKYGDLEGKIIIESPHFPPSEMIGMLEAAGVELRLIPKSQAPEMQSSKATPAPQKKKTTKAKAKPSNTKKKTPTKRAAKKPSQSSTKPPASTRTAPQRKATPTPSRPAPSAPVRETKPSPQPARPQRQRWEDEDDLPSPVRATPGQSQLVIGWICLVLAILGAVYSLSKMANPPKVQTIPRNISPATVSSHAFPKQSYVSVSLKPDRKTFVLIPVRGIRSGYTENYVLFASKENRKLLIFAPQRESQILSDVIQVPDKEIAGVMRTRPIWKKDVKDLDTKPKSRTYTGVLERLQRRPNGPLELVLPDENRNINRIPGLIRSGVQFPLDSMLLLVGERMKPVVSYAWVWLLFSLLFGLFGGGMLFWSHQQSHRPF